MRHQQHQRQAAERRGSLAEAAALWAELHGTVDELHQAVAGFVHTYNTQWLIGRLGHHTPKGAYQAAMNRSAPMACGPNVDRTRSDCGPAA